MPVEKTAPLVMVDTCVCSDAQLGRWVNVPTEVVWGNQAVASNVAALERKPLPNDHNRATNIACLPTIGRLARERRIRLATYDELRFEESNASRSARGTVGDALGGVTWERAEPAVDRSFFVPTVFPSGYKSEMLIDFCQYLLSGKLDAQRWPAGFVESLPAMTRDSLGHLDEFRQLCRHIQTPTILPDLFHLWTGEVNGCEFFLTMETTLPNFCASHVHRPIACRPIDPMRLLHELGVRELDPAFAEVGEHAGFFEARRLDDQK